MFSILTSMFFTVMKLHSSWATRAFDHILLPLKFHDNISAGSRVIALTNKQTNRQTHPQTYTTENNTTSLRYATPVAKNRSTFAKLIVKIKIGTFLRPTV